MVLKELCALSGLSGNEGAVRDYIVNYIGDRAEVTIDRIGNVIARKKGTNGKKVTLAAHMDEVGLIVVGINEDGLLSFRPVGGIDPRVLVSKPVLVGEDMVPGVIGAKAIHLQSPEERKQALPVKQLYIDIGASDKKEAARLVSPGDYVTFDSEWIEFGTGMVKARALDDRVGVMTMLSVLEEDYPCDVTCAFTVQEELGTRGARCAALTSGEADALIVLEGTTANDAGGIDEEMQVCKVGKGVAVSFMDRASIANVKLYAALNAIAEEEDIPHQVKQFVSGGNDAGTFQTYAGPKATCVLSVPVRYIHSPSSAAAFSDIEAQYRLVDAFLRRGGEV